MIWHGNERSKNRNIMRLNTFALDMLDNVGHVGHFLQPRWHMCMSRRRCLEIGDDFVEERGSWGKCGAVSSFLGCRLSSCLKPFFLVSIASMTFRLKTFWLRCVCCHERSMNHEWLRKRSRKHPQVMNPHPRSGQRLGLSDCIDLLGVCSAFCIVGESHGQHDWDGILGYFRIF